MVRRGGTEHIVACAVVRQVLATKRASSHLAAGRPYLLCAHNDGIIEEFHSAARVVHLSLECTATLCQSPFQHPVRFHPIFFDLEMTRFLFRLTGVCSVVLVQPSSCLHPVHSAVAVCFRCGAAVLVLATICPTHVVVLVSLLLVRVFVVNNFVRFVLVPSLMSVF